MMCRGITDERYNTYYRNNPTKLVEFYCNVRLKWWQIFLLGLLQLNKNEKQDRTKILFEKERKYG